MPVFMINISNPYLFLFFKQSMGILRFIARNEKQISEDRMYKKNVI